MKTDEIDTCHTHVLHPQQETTLTYTHSHTDTHTYSQTQQNKTHTHNNKQPTPHTHTHTHNSSQSDFCEPWEDAALEYSPFCSIIHYLALLDGRLFVASRFVLSVFYGKI